MKASSEDWISVEDFLAITEIVEEHGEEMRDGWIGSEGSKWRQKLMDLGFEPGEDYRILVHPSKGLVLKRAYMPRLGRSPIPEAAIPTEILTKPSHVHHVIALQPLAQADKETRYAAQERYYELWGIGHELFDHHTAIAELDRTFGTDIHSGNFAVWQGRDVVIDW